MVDLNSATGSLLRALLVFVNLFCTKEKGYPLKTSTDSARYFFSPSDHGTFSPVV